MIGFVGLGTMGRPMARNLARGSAEILLNDACQRRIAKVVDEIKTDAPQSRARAARLAEIAVECDTVFLCLPNGDVVRNLEYFVDDPIWMRVKDYLRR